MRTAAVHVATPGDLDRLAPLAAEFYAASRFLKTFDIERFRAVWTQLIESGLGRIWLLEDGERIAGTLGAMLYPDLYSGALIATEFFWFVSPGARGGGMRLYHSFEGWARERDCTEIRMVHLHDSMPEQLARVYRRLGYEAAETHYRKEI